MSESTELSDKISGIEEKFPRGQALHYGISKLGWGMAAGTMGFLVYFYQIKLGLSWEWISLAFMIYAIWNAINDPLFGVISDRSKHKLGRRIPYMRYGAPFLGISFIMIWIPFVTASDQVGLFFYLLFVLFLYDTFFTLTVIVNVALLGELALTAKNRTKITFVSGTVAGIGSAVSAILPPIFLYNSKPLEKPIDPFQIFIIIIGIITFVTLFLSSYFLKEKGIFQEEQPGFIDSIKYTIKNKAFLIIEIIIFIGMLISTFFLTGVSYYITYALGLTDFEATIPIILFILSTLIGSLIFTFIGGKLGIRKSILISIPIVSVGLFLAFFPTNLWQAVLPVVLIGIGESSLMIFMDPALMDVADSDELKTGRRREASFFGVNALITKPAESIAVWMWTGLLSLFAFVQPVIDEWGIAYPQPQTAESLFGIRILMSVVPAIMVLLLLIPVYFYPLDGSKYREMKQLVHQLHLKKEKKLLDQMEFRTN